MGRIVDTSVFIALERAGDLRQAQLGLLAGTDEHYITAIQVAEFGVGIELADSPQRRERRQQGLRLVLDYFEVLDFDRETALVWSRLFAQLRRDGESIGDRDLIIAAIAMRHQHSILTGNVREFEKVLGLTIERWP